MHQAGEGRALRVVGLQRVGQVQPYARQGRLQFGGALERVNRLGTARCGGQGQAKFHLHAGRTGLFNRQRLQ